jgi:hypothetical protein
MKNSTLIKNVNIVNEGQIKIADVLFKMVLSNILTWKKQLMMH